MTINDNINGLIDENALAVACVISDPSTPVQICIRANVVTRTTNLNLVSHRFSLTISKIFPAFLIHPNFHFSHCGIMSLSQDSRLSLSITDSKSNLSTNFHMALKH